MGICWVYLPDLFMGDDDLYPCIFPKATSAKVMTFNVQYVAGKNYIFYYDGGKDSRPSPEDIGHRRVLFAAKPLWMQYDFTYLFLRSGLSPFLMQVMADNAQ